MDTQAQNLRNMFTGTAFSDPMRHAKMARDIGVDPIGTWDEPPLNPHDTPMSGEAGEPPLNPHDTPMSGEADEPPLNPHDTPMSGEAGEPPLNPHDTPMSGPDGVSEESHVSPDDHMPGPERTSADEPTPRRRRPTLSNSDTFTSSYEPKMDPFRRHVERVFEGIGVVQIPDFVHDSYDEEIMGNYKAHQEREESMRETHRKKLEERDKEHNYEMEEVYADRNKYKKHYKDQLAKMREAKTDYQTKEQNYKDELSRLNQELQNARTRPATAARGPSQADLDREHEYETAPSTSRYNENKFNTGDKRRPSPFREQTRGMEPTDKYHISARYEI
jgi:hypothetical protein